MAGKAFNLSKGVFSFNGRKGLVIPQAGDYTAEMVGAVPSIESEEYPGCFYRMVDGVQEWINPPMEAGIEYRTIERYNGSVVYARLSEITGFGTPGSITEVDIDVGDPLSNLVAYSAQISGWGLPTLMFGGGVGAPLTKNGNVQVEVRASSIGNIEVYLYSESRNMVSATVKLLVKYTKS